VCNQTMIQEVAKGLSVRKTHDDQRTLSAQIKQ